MWDGTWNRGRLRNSKALKVNNLQAVPEKRGCNVDRPEKSRMQMGYGQRNHRHGSMETMRAEDVSLAEWIKAESERRRRQENPHAPAQLRPLDDFSDEYADPTRYKTVDQARVGPKSAVLQGLINGECCGWVKQPTTEELYEAIRAEKPTSRQKSLAGVLVRADFWDLMGAWMEGAFTWRQLAPRNEPAPMAETTEGARNQQERNVEELTLPEPAASLWKRIRGTVHELGNRREEQRIEPHLGGGTTLAARWGHRRSTDIDVTLPGDASLGDLTRNDKHNLAYRIGGKADPENADEIKVICADGALHLARPKPHAPGAEAVALVDGEPETVLSNAQILRGKLLRAHDSPVRDVFDVICAAKADPRALATATGMLDGQQTERIATRWRGGNEPAPA